jgi:carbon starvation protein
MNTVPIMLGVLCLFAVMYRYYSAFIAARVLMLDDDRKTPAHTYADGHNYVASPKWVLFGHHFAAIAGAGPLVGPTLAAQFGFAPGLLWILAGAVLAGAVQGFTVLVASMRHKGQSLPEIARSEIGSFAGTVAMVAVLFILVVSLAGLGLVVVNALAHSPWGLFTIGTTITAGVLSIRDIFWPLTQQPGKEVQGYLDSGLMALFITGVVLVVANATRRCLATLHGEPLPSDASGPPVPPDGPTMTCC